MQNMNMNSKLNLKPDGRPKLDPALATTLHTLAIVSVLGFTYCLLMLMNILPAGNMSSSQLMIYALWFIVAVVSAYAMLFMQVWGAYLLGGATLLVTAFELITGVATMSGAFLGVLVIYIVLMYLYPHGRDMG